MRYIKKYKFVTDSQKSNIESGKYSYLLAACTVIFLFFAQSVNAELVCSISIMKDVNSNGILVPQGKSPELISGQTVYIKATIENKSNKAWAFDSREAKNPHSFPVIDSEGKQLSRTVWIDYLIFPVDEQQVAAREQYSFNINLNEFYAFESGPGGHGLLEPGKYSVQMILKSPVQEHKIPEDKKWPDDLWPKTIKSNILNFTIKGISEEEIKFDLLKLKSQTLSDKERISIINSLSANRVKIALPEILSILINKDSSEKVKAEAMNMLYRIGDKSIAPMLEKILLEDKSKLMRSFAANLLEQYGSKSCVPSLIKVLKERHPSNYEENASGVWYAPIIRTLGEFGDKDALPILDEIAQKDPTTWVRELAAKNAKKIRNSED